MKDHQRQLQLSQALKGSGTQVAAPFKRITFVPAVRSDAHAVPASVLSGLILLNPEDGTVRGRRLDDLN